MANILPVPVKQRIKASGALAPITLIDIQTIQGALFGWSDAQVQAPSVLLAAILSATPTVTPSFNPRALMGEAALTPAITPSGLPSPPSNMAYYQPWLVTPPVFTQYKSTQTSTATFAIQNITGDTIRRDIEQIFSSHELVGALIYIRIWSMECAYSLFDFQGIVDEADINVSGTTMDVSVEGSYAWMKVPAPREQIGPTCGNIFNNGGSFFACGSTSATPCNNDYGTCSSLNRFNGIVTEYVTSTSTADQTQVAQQAPLRLYNPKVPN